MLLTVPVNGTDTVELLQVERFGKVPTVGVGLTLIIKLCEIPLHPFANGVTVTVEVTATVPVFVAVNDPISPVPAAAMPILPLLVTQL